MAIDNKELHKALTKWYASLYEFAEERPRVSGQRTDFHSVVDDLNVDLKSSFEPCVRPSRIPTCAIRLFMELCDGEQHGYMEEDTLLLAYYTGVGTLTHAILQRFAAKTGKYLGDYLCLTCGKEHRMSTKHICPKCKTQMLYKEIAIDHMGIKGHLDGGLEWKPKRIVLLDWKGSNMKKCAAKTPNFSSKNPKQLESYCTALRRKLKGAGYKLDGWGLFYTPRDTPNKERILCKAMNKKDFRVAKERYAVQAAQQEALKIAKTTYKVRQLIDVKPCADMDDYKKEIHDPYSACPLTPICFNSPKRLYDILKDKAQELKKFREKQAKKANKK